MVHRMQRMTMFASNISKTSASAAGGQGACAGGATKDNTNTIGVTSNPEISASAPPNSPFPSSPKNANTTTTDCSSSNVDPKRTASTTAPTTKTTTTAPVAAEVATATSSNH